MVSIMMCGSTSVWIEGLPVVSHNEETKILKYLWRAGPRPI